MKKPKLRIKTSKQPSDGERAPLPCVMLVW